MSSNSDITTTNPQTDWKYVSEGGATIVFSYIGPPNPAFDGMVLRLRKVPNVPIGVRDDTDSSDTDEEEEEEEEEDPTISFQRLCMSRLIPLVHLPTLRSVIVRMDPVRSVSIDEETGLYLHKQRTMPGDFHGPPHIHSNRWLRSIAKAHESERSEVRKKTGGGVDVHKQKGVLATDLVGGNGISVEIKPKWSFLPNPTYLSESTRPVKSKTCRFCMHSYIRSQISHSNIPSDAHGHEHAQGQVALGYCPLDLFSNDEARVRKALYALWDAWVESEAKVNNLKIFVEGKILRPDQHRLLLVSSYRDGAETDAPIDNVRETFTSALIPLLTRTPALQTLNRLQKSLDMLDVEGLEKVWKAYHQSLKLEEIPELGFGIKEPTIDEWMGFIDLYLEQRQKKPTEIDGREYPFLPAPLPPTTEKDSYNYTELELRSYLLAYLLSATFKDCSVIFRIPLLTEQTEDTPVDPKNVTIIDLDPKSMTRLRRWELLDAQIAKAYGEVKEDERKICVDAKY